MIRKAALWFVLLCGVAVAGVGDGYTPPAPLHALINVQTFCLVNCTTTSTGTYTPTAGTNSVEIEVVAAGGGSGGCGATNAAQVCIGGSAASGSYMRAWFNSGFSGITMTIGAAGTAGTAVPSAGGLGGTTSAGSLISCPGGTGGVVGVTSAATVFLGVVAGVAGPSACTNTGGIVEAPVPGQASGIGSAFSVAAGNQIPGPSGNTPLGQGAPAFIQPGATSIGTAGTGYGWGAGGSSNDASQSATVGLAGGPSRIIVREFN